MRPRRAGSGAITLTYQTPALAFDSHRFRCRCLLAATQGPCYSHNVNALTTGMTAWLS